VASTSKGFPYPLGTDRVADGDNAIQALAEKVDTAAGLHAAGSVTVTTTGANPSEGAVAVTFPAGRFTAAPRVVLQQLNQLPGAAADYSTLYPNGLTAGGFTVNCRRHDAKPVSAVWVAIQID
jgi:hypothetical protein